MEKNFGSFIRATFIRVLGMVLWLWPSQSLTAQNLVPNSSFEALQYLPVKDNPKNTFEYEPQSGYIPFQINLKNWFAGSSTTPDLRINSSEGLRECTRIFKNCDRARTGSHTVGLITYLENTSTDTYREYLEVKLKKPLRPHEKTYVEFWVAKERQAKLVSNNLGCYFTRKKVYAEIEENLDIQPQFNQDSLINETEKKWVKISGAFIPDQPFEYLTIGNFFDNEHTKVIVFKNYNGSPYVPPYAYYLIDDVRVWQEEDRPEEEPLVFQTQTVSPDKAIVLDNIFFDHDSAVLKSASLQELEELYTFLQEYPTLKIAIHGHTDSNGRDQYNERLSEARARAVFRFLMDKGIAEKRLSYAGFGERQPLDSNDSGEGRGKNRRVEFKVVEH